MDGRLLPACDSMSGVEQRTGAGAPLYIVYLCLSRCGTPQLLRSTVLGAASRQLKTFLGADLAKPTTT
jgi:hypothetical protein